jgi:hypothetical protein
VRRYPNTMWAVEPQHMRHPGYTVTVTDPHVEYMAHHMLLLAVPAFLPAVIVVGVILYVAMKDRRGGAPDKAGERSDATDEKRD